MAEQDVVHYGLDTSYYFGLFERAEANEILSGYEVGSFFFRDSKTVCGKVLSVREASEFQHFAIQRLSNGKCKIAGKETFDSLEHLLEHFKKRVLNKTKLGTLVPKSDILYTATHAYRDEEEGFSVAAEEIVIFVYKDTDWLTGINEAGQVGCVPLNRVKRYVTPIHGERRLDAITTGRQLRALQKRLPFECVAVRGRRPSVYDNDALFFQAGETILVDTINSDGMWVGRVLLPDTSVTARGFFPYTYLDRAMLDTAETWRD